MNTGTKYIKENLSGFYSSEEIRSLALIIMEYVLPQNSPASFFCKDIILNSYEFEKIKNIVGQLKVYKPIQYIIGTTVFYGLDLEVEPGVLIPRPETEELVDKIVRFEKWRECEGKQIKILDFGTGSGCIAISLSLNLRPSSVFAVDNSEQALKVAAKNALFNHAPVTFMNADILSVLPSAVSCCKWDLIVSNPPYVTCGEKKSMMRNVLDYEPGSALFVENENPLKFYKRIAALSFDLLSEKGIVYFEINENFGSEMESLMKSSGFCRIELIKDLFGKDRFIRAEK